MVLPADVPTALTLTNCRTYPRSGIQSGIKSGIISLSYDRGVLSSR